MKPLYQFFIHFSVVFEDIRNWTESFCLFGRNFVLPVQNFVGRNFFWKNFYLCNFFVHFGQKSFTHRTKNVLAVFSNKHCTCPGQKFGWNSYLEKLFFYFFSDFERQIDRFWTKFSKAWYYWRSFYVPRKLERSNKNEKNYGFLLSLGFLSGKFRHFAQNRWGSVFKTALYVPRDKLRRKLFSKKSTCMLLLGPWAERFRTLSENFLHVSQNCILRL